MARTKIKTERDLAIEKHAGVMLESCTTFRHEDGAVNVIGEAVSQNGKSINEYRTIQVILYDSDGDIIGRDYTNWIEFGLRQSFELEFNELDFEVTRAKVFPTKE